MPNAHLKSAVNLLVFTLIGLGVILVFADPSWANKTNKELNKLIENHESLEKNEKEGRLRHTWERLERSFTQLAKKSQGDVKAQSEYYVARSRHSLAQRSFTNLDYQKAIKDYSSFIKNYPKHSLTAEALYSSAQIQAYWFKDKKAAQKLAERLINEFPQSSQFRDATVFLEKLSTPAKGGTKAKSVASSKTSTVNRAEQLGLTVRRIMIDAGHGGRDPGAEGNGISEHQLTLKMANLVGKELQARGFTVIYTRKNNSFISLGKRTEMANDQKADLFVSIHANANKDTKLSGLETYYLDSTSSARAKKVAARENAVEESQLSDVQFILTDLMLNSKLKESRTLARMVHNGILSQIKRAKFRYADNGVRPGPFYVLMGARMPAVLVEMGYLTNKRDAELLKSNSFLAQQAKGIADGIVAYKKEVAKGFE